MKIFTSGTRLSKGACALAVAGAVALPLAPVLAENINIAAQNVAAQNVAAGDQATPAPPSDGACAPPSCPTTVCPAK